MFIFNRYLITKMCSKRIKIYNDIDATCYEIVYSANKKILTDEFSELQLTDTHDNITNRILQRITNDVINIALENKTRCENLSFDNVKFKANEDYSEMRFYTHDNKRRGHLHKVCAYCLTL